MTAASAGRARLLVSALFIIVHCVWTHVCGMQRRLSILVLTWELVLCVSVSLALLVPVVLMDVSLTPQLWVQSTSRPHRRVRILLVDQRPAMHRHCRQAHPAAVHSVAANACAPAALLSGLQQSAGDASAVLAGFAAGRQTVCVCTFCVCVCECARAHVLQLRVNNIHKNVQGKVMDGGLWWRNQAWTGVPAQFKLHGTEEHPSSRHIRCPHVCSAGLLVSLYGACQGITHDLHPLCVCVVAIEHMECTNDSTIVLTGCCYRVVGLPCKAPCTQHTYT